jgi:hypothetical protein
MSTAVVISTCFEDVHAGFRRVPELDVVVANDAGVLLANLIKRIYRLIPSQPIFLVANNRAT